MDASNLLEISHLTRAFPKVVALEDVSLAVRRGEIHGIVGEPGAGKTTLMKILGGFHPAGSFEGEILFEGQPFVAKNPRDALVRGIAIVPRQISLFWRLSVGENAVIGCWQQERRFIVTRDNTNQLARQLLDHWGLVLDLDARADQITAVQQRLLMIARGLCTKPRLVVLDDPTFGIKQPQALSQLLLFIRRMAEREITCLYLTRQPADAFRIADRVTGLRDGSVAGIWERAAFDEAVVARAIASQRDGEPGRAEEYEDYGTTGGILGSFRSLFDRWMRPRP